MALTDTTQIREAIVALSESEKHVMDGYYNQMIREGQMEALDNARRSRSDLAHALALSLKFKVGYVLSTQAAGLIDAALDEKKKRDDYLASAEYKALRYKRDHPVFIRRDGSHYTPVDSLLVGSYGGTDGDYVEYQIGKKVVAFHETEPGIWKEGK